MTRHLALAAAVATMLAGGQSAFAGTEALISLYGTDDGSWQRRVEIQDMLQRDFGFDHVRVLVDATNDEVPKEVRRFLERPKGPGDHRFVWVSGPVGKKARSICPPRAARSIRPAAPSVVLAPACYSDIIRLPQGARHYGLTTPKSRDLDARIGRIDAQDPVWIAALALPAGKPRHVLGADAMIFDHLKAGRRTHRIDAVRLLKLLRTEFRWDGGAYTPTLELYSRGTEGDSLGPFARRQDDEPPSKLNRVKPVRLGARFIALHESTAARGAVRIRPAAPIRVLRADASGAMRYVAVGENLFGWVKRHDLGL